MAKIVDLFNEYNCSPEMAEGEPVEERTEREFKLMSREDRAYMLSKDFGRIKRLVDNDKIDIKYLDRIGSGEFIYDMDGNPYYNSCTCEDLEEYDDVDRVLMLLAISDNPIDFLIEILK